MASVLIVAEHQRGRIKKATRSAITFGRRAAELLEAELRLLVIGHQVSAVVDQLRGFGAAGIQVADDPALAHGTAEVWGHVVAEAARICRAELVGMNSGTTGRDVMPRVAAKLNAGMASDVLGFDGRCFTRAMWAGSALAEVEVTTAIKVATIQATAFEPAAPSGGETPVERLAVSWPAPRTRFVELRETKSARPELTEARVVVSGGRGLDGAEHFGLLEELADLFGGAVGATRAAVDAGWAPNDLQVGQTGKIVAPELYVAVGLSGSTQHMAGMKNSQVIVAINKDEEAPIFEIADYGLVADLFEALPQLIEALKKELAAA